MSGRPWTVVVPAGVRLLVGGRGCGELLSWDIAGCVRVDRDEVRRDVERGDGGASGSGGMAVPCSALLLGEV